MKTTRRSVAFMALLLAVCLLLSCAMAENQREIDTSRDSVTIAYNKAVDNFSPMSSLVEQGTASMIFEPLFRRDDRGNFYPRIAKSWEWITPTTLHVVLNDDVYDTAGNHITTSDVVFTLSERIDPGNNTTFIDYTNCELISETEMNIPMLASAQEAILNTLASMYIVDEDAYTASEDNMSLTPIGCGPYMLTEHVSNSHCILTFNENWHLKTEEPQIKTVKVMFITDAQQRLNVLRSHEVDYAYGLDFNYLDILNKEPNIVPMVKTIDNQLGLYFNMQSELFKDNYKLRQAICYAINNAAVSMINKKGMAPVAKAIGVQHGAAYTETFTAAIEEMVSDTNYYEYNLEKAKELIAEAGVPKGTTIRFLYFTTAGMDTLAKVLMGSLQEIGLTLELDLQQNSSSYAAKLFSPEGYDLTPLSLESNPLDTWFQVSANTWNMSKLPPEKLAPIAAKVNAAFVATGADREAALLELEKIYYDNLYAYAIYDDVGLAACYDNVDPWMFTFLHPDYTKWVIYK